MPSLSIDPVATGADRKQFLNLPWQLYQGDPYWVPPLRQQQWELLNYQHHPFYDQAKIATFLARRDGRPVGRIAAIVNQDHLDRYDERVGFFGFFESIDDQEVASGLFEAARKWLAEQDLQLMRGPVNPSLNYDCGLLVEGFDSSPFFMMTYNRPYYERLILDAGFAQKKELYAYWGHVDMLQGLDTKLAFVVEESTRRFDLRLRRLDKSRFNQEVRMFLDIYNQSLGGTWGFAPLSSAEIDHMAAGLQHLIVPELTTIAEVDGRPIGAVFGLLDYNPRIKQIDGRLFPFGFMRLLWNKRKIQNARLLSTNVLPEYQRWGVGLVVLHRLIPDILAWGIKEVEFSWVLEDNHLSRKTLERGGAIRTKTYRIYDSLPAASAQE